MMKLSDWRDLSDWQEGLTQAEAFANEVLEPHLETLTGEEPGLRLLALCSHAEARVRTCAGFVLYMSAFRNRDHADNATAEFLAFQLGLHWGELKCLAVSGKTALKTSADSVPLTKGRSKGANTTNQAKQAAAKERGERWQVDIDRRMAEGVSYSTAIAEISARDGFSVKCVDDNTVNKKPSKRGRPKTVKY